ncbi:DUF4065 domain-containing protein [Pigmentibacter sp. JX0631]|uniref:Panacea domain-containing protein n=1 Tax=Pigmentibacter sp. JX0631 TaxID=2976982 RepID=UPI002469C05B|nr:type II toxin-antitoxin system antitoxin SocA domain-containing protein [Pigmentibacter sp. JX0631]WGL60038.1 DUF4065 domain-containing protein [Pigmentibacter sp. JX0631]
MKDISFVYEITKKYSKDPKNDLTTLKLQKLAYYCYGAALAYDLDSEVEGIEFEAWKYGPVNRKVYNALKNLNAPYYKVETSHEAFQEIQNKEILFSPKLLDLISVILSVYGRLSPRSLVDETHEETVNGLDNPWKLTYREETNNKLIDKKLIKNFFKQKFNNAEKRTYLPLGLFDYNSFLLDNIPIVAFEDIREVARYLEQEKTV